MTEYPADRSYTEQHEWVQVTGLIARIGVTEHAASALGDIVYASLPTVGANVAVGDTCAELESTKSVSDVYAPVTGVIAAINDAVADAPETINDDPFQAGWLFDIQMESGLPDGLLDVDAYEQLVSGSDG